MLVWQRIKNFCAMAGYARAASELAREGYLDEAKKLMTEKVALSTKKGKAINRLEHIKDAKASYEPGDHYMRGKSVAFWKGRAA